jgi:hypothetical protein
MITKVQIIFLSFLYIPATMVGDILFELLNLIWTATDYDGFHDSFGKYLNPFFKGIISGMIAYKLLSFTSEKFGIYYLDNFRNGGENYLRYLNIIPLLYTLFFIYLALGDYNQDNKDTFTIVVTYISFTLFGPLIDD